LKQPVVLVTDCCRDATLEVLFARPCRGGAWFAGAVKTAGVQQITPHDLRHSCASLAISAGVNVLALQRMLGHKSAKVTLDMYADLFDDDLDAVAVTLHSRYSREDATKLRPRSDHDGR
jgi:integrase